MPTVLSNVLANLIRSVGRSREAGAGIVLGGVLNIILDPVFMFLLLPDGYEVLGAGIATCLSNCIACLYFLTVLARMGRQSVITFRLGAGMAEKAVWPPYLLWASPPPSLPCCLIWIIL